MSVDRRGHRRRPGREAQPGYHDPTYRLGGAAPSRSALTLRLVLATFGLIACTAGAVAFALAGADVVLVLAPAALALVAAVDVGVILRRRAQGR